MSGSDDRIEVRFGTATDAGPDDALLIEGDAPSAWPAMARFRVSSRIATHPMGCACCLPRGPVADSLGRLFLARARGQMPWFRAVVAVTSTDAGIQAVRAALDDDLVTRARFRAIT